MALYFSVLCIKDCEVWSDLPPFIKTQIKIGDLCDAAYVWTNKDTEMYIGTITDRWRYIGRVLQNQYKQCFIPLAEYREQRINEILED